MFGHMKKTKPHKNERRDALHRKSRVKTNPDVDKAWFREKLAEKGKTQRALARYMELDPSGVSLLLDGERRMQLDYAEKIARFLGEPAAEVVRRSGLDIERRSAGGQADKRIQITGYVDGAGEIHLTKPTGSTTAIPATTPADAVAVRMEGGFAPGAAIVYVPAAEISVEAIGRLSVIEIKGGTKYLGVPTTSHERGRFNVSLPKSNMNDIEMKSATPVLWLRP